MHMIFPVWSHNDRGIMGKVRDAAAESSRSVTIFDEIAERIDWFDIARQRIMESDCVLLVLTKHSAVSENCMSEVMFARSIKRPVAVWAPGELVSTPVWAAPAHRLGSQDLDAAEAIDLILDLLHWSANKRSGPETLPTA